MLIKSISLFDGLPHSGIVFDEPQEFDCIERYARWLKFGEILLDVPYPNYFVMVKTVDGKSLTFC